VTSNSQADAQAMTSTIIITTIVATSITGVSIFVISRSLQREGKKRTEELRIANNQLVVANEDKIKFDLTDVTISSVEDMQPRLLADRSNNKVKVLFRPHDNNYYFCPS
jgi:hypothetical protein